MATLSLDTYAGLKTAVADYLGRNDLADRIPTFIRIAEATFNRELRIRVMERRAVAVTAGGDLGVTLPNVRTDDDWNVFLEMRDVCFQATGGNPQNLTYMPVDEYRMEITPSGQPKKYTIIGNTLFFAPHPDAAGKVILTYYSELQPLSDTVACNPLLHIAPDLYLYGALMASAPFTRESVPMETWNSFYTNALNTLKANDRRATFTSNLTMKPVRRI